jgi:hypothetical protein
VARGSGPRNRREAPSHSSWQGATCKPRNRWTAPNANPCCSGTGVGSGCQCQATNASQLRTARRMGRVFTRACFRDRILRSEQRGIMPKEEHGHPGLGEPRSQGRTHHEQRKLDLNTASVEELADLPKVGRERAEKLVQSRPFRSWGDIERPQRIEHGGRSLGGIARLLDLELDHGHGVSVTTSEVWIPPRGSFTRSFSSRVSSVAATSAAAVVRSGSGYRNIII